MGKRVLIVDDDGMNLRMAAHALKMGEYEVALAKSGAQGIDNLMKTPADLVLLDVEMPEMNGFETLERIRNTEEIKDTKVVFLSGTVTDEAQKKAEELGANGFISKPFAPDALLAKLADII